MRAPLAELLHGGEEQRVALLVQSVYRLWPLAVPAIAFSVLLATQGLELKSWVIPVSIGLYMVLTIRNFFVIATDTRVLVVRLSPWTMKRWTFEGEMSRSSIEKVLYQERLLQDRLTLVPKEGKPQRYSVVRGWEEEARRLVALLERTQVSPGDLPGPS